LKKEDGKLRNDDLDRFNNGLAKNFDKERNKTIRSPLEKMMSCEQKLKRMCTKRTTFMKHTRGKNS
jgi:hypothetical protein